MYFEKRFANKEQVEHVQGKETNKASQWNGFDKGGHVGKPLGIGMLGSNLKRYVSFYFTNFPAQLPLFYIRKGFEVCGILEDVYIAKQCNRFGEPYGFVKFSNVRDVSKLTKALNAVYFGHYRIRASLARFDRSSGPPGSLDDGGEKKGVEVSVKAVGDHKGGKSDNKVFDAPYEGVKVDATVGCGITAPLIKAGSGNPDGVRVGDVLVKLGCQQGTGDCANVSQQEVLPTSYNVDDVPQNKIYLRKYRTTSTDVEWARSGVVATIRSGEVIEGK
ncbi:hypothetical protein P8452_52282 [Trifolium repens]|nr:hypothetical protein P8452_52282 [Trifolium repens]